MRPNGTFADIDYHDRSRVGAPTATPHPVTLLVAIVLGIAKGIRLRWNDLEPLTVSASKHHNCRLNGNPSPILIA